MINLKLIFITLLALAINCQNNAKELNSTINRRDTNNNGIGDNIAAKTIYGLMFMLIGFVFLFFGKKILKTIIFLAGSIAGFQLTLVFASFFVEGTVLSQAQYYTIIIAGLVVGFIFGSLALCVWQLGLMLLGGAFGFSLGSFILASGLVTSQTTQNIIVIALTVACAILVIFFKNILVGGFTAFIGSFLIVLGIDMFLGYGYQQSIQGVLYGQKPERSNMAWVLMAINLVLFCIGFFFQRRFRV